MPTIQSDFPRGAAGRGQSAGPSSHFESTENLTKTPALQFSLPNEEGKLFLGVLDAEMDRVRLPDGRVDRFTVGGHPIGVPDDRHIITIAGSRSGKGRSALIPNLITYPGSMLVIDPKGDLARETASWRAEMLGQKVIVLDPFSAAGAVSHLYSGGFNPLSTLNPESETFVEDAGLIADSLIVPAPSAKDPHWDESAKLFLEGVIMHVASYEDYSTGRDLVSVYRCLMDMTQEFEEEMKENVSANFAIMEAGNSFFEKQGTERAGVLSTLRRHIRFLGYPPIQKVLREHSFDLKELKTRNFTLYLSLPAMRMGTCSRWLRLFVNLTLAAMEAERTKPRYPLLMCLDEFAILGPMKAVEDAAGQIAGLGCKLWPILQDLGQLKALYQNRWETFMGNAGVLQFFGNSDLQTLEWISKRLGQTTIVTSSRSNPSYESRVKGGATGDSWAQHVHPLMTVEEISRFFGRDDALLRQLIIRPTWHPMVLQRAYYDKHALFSEYRKYVAQK